MAKHRFIVLSLKIVYFTILTNNSFLESSSAELTTLWVVHLPAN